MMRLDVQYLVFGVLVPGMVANTNNTLLFLSSG